MKKLFVVLAISTALILMSASVDAQTVQSPTNPPLSQPLVREGDFAMRLAESLGLGAAENEADAESALSAVGIAPRNGWIADYPVTPDIVAEVETAVREAADSGGLTIGNDEALNAFYNVITGYGLDLRMDTSGREAGDTSGAEYPDSAAMGNYYAEEGPPIITYYAPPPDYAYLYTWVPYPFWGWNYWFPGFFVLGDFDVRVHGHGHDHGRDHGHGDHGGGKGKHERDHGGSVTNHFRDSRTGKMLRIDPANRVRGGTLPDRGRSTWSSPSAKSGAQSIFNTRRAPSARVPSGTTRGELRGYGNPRSSMGIRSSVFDRSGNRRIERSSSGRGFRSRTNAGQIRGSEPRGGQNFRSGPTGGSRSGMTGGSRGGSGGFHGGGRR